MNGLVQDLRYAVRALMRRPGFTAVIVLTIGLAVGANTAIFSVLYSVALEPLPYPQADRLVVVWERNFPRERERNVVASVNYLDWRRQSRSFESLAAIQFGSLTVGDDTPERVAAASVTPGFFRTLGVPPALGRDFDDRDIERESRVAIIGHALWQRRFAGDPGAVGRRIAIDGASHTVIGVLGRDFEVPEIDPGFEGATAAERQVWLPLAPDPEYSGRSLVVLGRLAAGVTPEQARSEISAIAARLEAEHEYNRGWGASVVPLRDQVVGGVRPALLLLMGAVALVLLIACLNVANLLLARIAGRRREMALRAALGAGRSRLMRQLLTESLVLAITGGTLGLILAYWSVQLVVQLDPGQLPRSDAVRVGSVAFIFTVGLSGLAALIFGSLPALQGSRSNLRPALARDVEASRPLGAGRLRRAVVVLELALALMLLVGSGLLIRSFMTLRAVDPGFRPDGVLVARVSLPRTAYADDPEVVRFYESLLERVRSLPGAAAASAAMTLPFGGLGIGTSFLIEGQPDPGGADRPVADVRPVTPDHFRTLGIPLLDGRDFDRRDDAEAPLTAVINETMARRYWPGSSAIGGRVRVSLGEMIPFEVIGVVGDVRLKGLDQEPRATIYLAHAQFAVPSLALAVRATGDPRSLIGPVRDEVRALDPALPVHGIRTAEEMIGESIAERRFSMGALAAFALLALMLASVGLYGVISYAVAARTREIGIRVALGAEPRSVRRRVVAESLALCAAGTGLGLLGAVLLTRLMSGLLYGVEPIDPPTFVTVPLVLSAVAVVAAYVPARRASRIDPVAALRYE